MRGRCQSAGRDFPTSSSNVSAPDTTSLFPAGQADLGDEGTRALRASRPDLVAESADSAFVAGSVRDPACIEALRTRIARLGWGGGAVDANAALVANAREIEAIVRAGEALDHAAATIDARLPIDLLTGDLRTAIAALGEVTGETVTDEVLDGIFSRFCVGK